MEIKKKDVEIQQEIPAVNNVDNNPFTSNEQTVHHQPDKIILDFKNIYPQFVGNQPIMIINHRVILLDLYNTKEFLRVLKENLDKYEKTFGQIKKPAAIVKAENEIKSLQKEATTATAADRPSYTG